jgi:hypothetical protein
MQVNHFFDTTKTRIAIFASLAITCRSTFLKAFPRIGTFQSDSQRCYQNFTRGFISQGYGAESICSKSPARKHLGEAIVIDFIRY